MFGRYLKELLDVFVKWWWAVITGVASILSWLAVPATGVTVGKFGVSVAIFVSLTILFLLISMMIKSYSWFMTEGAPPRVERFVPVAGEKDVPCRFIIREGGRRLAPGYVLSLFRNVAGEEVCIAVLRLEEGGREGAFQCVPLWIAPVHLQELSTSRLNATELIVKREVTQRALAQMRNE